MNANLPDAEMMVAMGDPEADLTAGVEPSVEQPERNSPASAVCYMNLDEPNEPTAHPTAPANTAQGEHTSSEGHNVGVAGPTPRTGEESDTTSTPLSEMSSVMDTVTPDSQLLHKLEPEPGYFSPRPLRVYGSKLPASAPASTDPSPTSSLNASSTSVNAPEAPSDDHTENSYTPADQLDRPSVQRDLSSNSTASVATVRAHSVDPLQTFTPPKQQQRDGPYFPNQSYAALHSQEYPPLHLPPSGRTRNPHSAHYPSLSAAHITTFGLPQEHHRDIMESGSRTVGNSPASSPGLFSPTTPPLRHTQQPDDGYYSSPYLHHTHRQVPKETHVADVDVDPVSGRKIINQYEVIDELGRGVHGKVKLGRNLETGVTVAIKIVDRYSKRRRLGKNTSHEDKIKREIAILKKARHPNVVSLLEVIDDPSRKKVYIVLEHVELGEVKWRTEGEKEVCLLEWRRYKRESQGIFDNENAAMEDEKILTLAHQKLDRQRRRRARLMHMRRHGVGDNELWSLEHGGESEDEASETSRQSQAQASTHEDEQTLGRTRPAERWEGNTHNESNMETAVRSTTPTATSRPEDPNMITGLEGTMYGAYDTDLIRGRAPSLADSSSSHLTDEEEEIPEHFRYVPLLTIQAAREIFRDTVLGLEYLHYYKVVHRDIKPANLLQTKEHRIKISDFGVSYLGRQTSEEPSGDQSESDAHDVDEAIELAKTVGTPAFYAPELCRTDIDIDTPQVDEGIDIWALGVTLYCLIYGRVPFHDHNTFHLMKMISDDEVYIPQWRLKAVAEQSGSRPNSHGRMYHSMTTSKRAPHDLDYEEVDDTLRDLLKRLLIKDSRQRIKIKEIKRHPWVLQGVDNLPLWVDETDPSRSIQGKKIEISKKDLDEAVVPLTLIDRVRSGVRKTLDTVLGISRRTGSRRRAQSTATNQDQPQSISANSSSSTISQEGRRPSLAMNQSIFEALSRSREPEHPLSQSVTASPETSERTRYFEGPSSRTGSPAYSIESTDFLAPSSGSSRPLPPERAHSTMSSAASVRTVRPVDPRTGRPVSPNLPPALPGTPTALDSPNGSNLGGIFGGVPRRLVNNVRSRERMLRPPHEHTRAKSIDRLSVTIDDPHSEPSLALSTTMAAGHVDQPDILKDLSPTHARGPSPHLLDLNSPDPTERASSRQSSISSTSSYRNRTYAAHDQLQAGLTQETDLWVRPTYPRETSDERYSRAKDDFVRRRVMEEKQGRARPLSMNIRRPTSSLSQPECPPSPDDETYFQRQKVEDYLSRGHVVSEDSTLVGYPMRPKALNSSSSEDHFTTMSQSTSNPSIPSVASANSSVAPDDCLSMQQLHPMPAALSGDSINQFNTPSDDPAGYDGDGDHPIESEDDESDEEDFIMMGSKKPVRSGSISNAELARSSIRKEYLSSRRRSTRSGSNGTVKKVRPPGDSDHEHQT